MNQKKLKWVDDIKIYKLGDDYILESDSKDIYCAINEEAYQVLHSISEGLTIEKICNRTSCYEAAKSIVEEIIDLELVNIV